MATILAQTCVDKAQILIQDATGVRWPEAELLGWLNDGQREIVLLKPSACVHHGPIQMTPGTKQTIPADGVALIGVRRNMGAAGTTPGRVVTLVDRRIMDDQVPDWHMDQDAAEAVHYLYDPDDPKHFYLWPPQPAEAHHMDVVYAKSPANVALGEVISVDDIYASALVDYVVYRAFSKDIDYAANDGRAATHYQSFARALGVKVQNEQTVRPKP